MKLSEDTVTILKNFSQINTGLTVKPGKVLRTISANKALLAEATITEEFPKEFSVYDLNKLLGVLSLHEEADLDFQESHIVFGGLGGRSKTRIRYTDPATVLSPPNKSVNVTYDVSITLSEDDFNWIEEVGAVLKCPQFVFTNEDGKVVLSALDVKGEVVDDASLVVGDAADDTPFRFVFKVDNLKILPGTYKVELSSRWVAKFSHQSKPVVYWVAVEQASSTFGKK